MSDAVDILQSITRERLSFRRAKTNKSLANYALQMTTVLTMSRNRTDIREYLSSQITPILDDCEIHFGMNETKASDTLRELSEYATFFVNEFAYEWIYLRVTDLIGKIRSSYPPK